MAVREVAPDDGGIAALSILGDRASDRVKRLIALYVIANAGLRIGRVAWNRARSEFHYTIAVRNDDEIFTDANQWLIDNLPPRRRRALSAVTVRRYVGDVPSAKLGWLYDGSRSQVAVIEGHRIRVHVERVDSSGRSEDTSVATSFRNYERIVFTAYGTDARDAVIRLLERTVDEHYRSRDTEFWIVDRWGGWMKRQDLPTRSLDTVILRTGQKEQLVADLDAFLKQEPAYQQLGIPYHRGYLLHGPPGTGKTSLARALATHFGLDMYYMPLGDMGADAKLLELVSQVQPRSMLLLEDIDVFHAARERDDTKASMTLSGLLNALDGVATPHGLIVVLTSNNVSVLDDAVVRPGRVDWQEEISYLDAEQYARLVASVIGVRPDLIPDTAALTPAEVVEVMKRHIGDIAGTLRALDELVLQ